MLDEAGFPNTQIVLSNDLDEMVIWQIITQIGAEAARYGVDPDVLVKRLVYGVGTRLITSQGDSALGGVYKLVAVREEGDWIPAIKISEQPQKTPNPGNKRAWRVYDTRGSATADLLSLHNEDPFDWDTLTLHHPSDHTKRRTLSRRDISSIEPLHVEVLREGNLVYDLPTIEAMRAQRTADLDRLDPGVRRLLNPHIYHVSLTPKLWEMKEKLMHHADNSA
jgi:nicotinate phosphoribosyltransferase